MHALAPMPARWKRHVSRQRLAEPARADLFGAARHGRPMHRGGWPAYLDRAGRGGADGAEMGGCACGGTCADCREEAGRPTMQVSFSDHAVSEGGGAPGPTDEYDTAGDRDGGQAVAPPAGTGPAPAQAPPAGAPPPAPAATSITTTTVAGPTWGNCRQFLWDVSWTTAGRNGFIVQEIVNSGKITNCADGTVQPNPFTPRYWEAWAVDGSGNVGDGGIDRWSRGQRNNTHGNWFMTGKVHFVTTLDPAAGFSRTAVADANGLLATTTQPSGLGPVSRRRQASGVWNCCGTNNTHTGLAW